MDKKLVASLIAAAFVAGIVLTWIFFSLGGRISGFGEFVTPNAGACMTVVP